MRLWLTVVSRYAATHSCRKRQGQACGAKSLGRGMHAPCGSRRLQAVVVHSGRGAAQAHMSTLLTVLLHALDAASPGARK